MHEISPIVAYVPPKYVSALLKLHDAIGSQPVEWAVGGDLAEALETVRVEPDCIEILTTKGGAEQIHELVTAFSPTQVVVHVQSLPRRAQIDGAEYPIYTKSSYFDFDLDGVKVKVEGDLQFKVGNWDWGDKLEFQPDTIYVVGKKTSVVPLNIKHDLYLSLGWMDRAEKIRRVFENQRRMRP